MGLKTCLSDSIRGLDKFGTIPSFHIRGKEKYTTWIGAITTIVIYVIMIFYAFSKGKNWYNRADMNYFSVVERDGIWEQKALLDEGLNLLDKKVNWALGFDDSFREEFGDYSQYG